MYMMTISRYGYLDCLTAVKVCREMANPNFGFKLQLQKYEMDKLEKVKQ